MRIDSRPRTDANQEVSDNDIFGRPQPTGLGGRITKGKGKERKERRNALKVIENNLDDVASHVNVNVNVK